MLGGMVLKDQLDCLAMVDMSGGGGGCAKGRLVPKETLISCIIMLNMKVFCKINKIKKK